MRYLYRPEARHYRAATGGAIVILLVVIGAADYETGAEARIAPLYFLPIGLAGWYLKRLGAIATCILATLAWIGSNYAAGLRFSNTGIWTFNIASQLTVFLIVALLLVRLRRQMHVERALARIDPMTGLLNARAFYELAELEIARLRRSGRPLTVVFVDLDNFKTVNDEHGHMTGDTLLAEVARSLTACMRTTDVIARLGGDEFGLLLPETDLEPGSRALVRMRNAIVSSMRAHGWPVTCSVGAVTFPRAPASVDAMVSAADALMYRVKAAGKDGVRIEVADSTIGSTEPSGAAPSADVARPAVDGP